MKFLGTPYFSILSLFYGIDIDKQKGYNILNKSKIINPEWYAGIHRYRNISFQTLNRSGHRNGIDKYAPDRADRKSEAKG